MFLRLAPSVLPLVLLTRALNSTATVSSTALLRSPLVRVPKSQVTFEPLMTGVLGVSDEETPLEKSGVEAVPSFRNESPAGRLSSSLKLARFPSGTVTCIR